MLKRLTDRIYYMPHDERTDRPVLGLVCGEKNCLVVDAGNSNKHVEEFLNEVSKMNIPPVKYVAITHWHWDHVFGIAYMNLTTLAQEKTNFKLKEMQKLKWDDNSLDERVKRGEEIEFCSSMIKLELPVRDNLVIGNADIIFSDKLEIDLGGLKCILENVGGDHSDDSSIVYIPEERVMFLGDCHYEDIYHGEWSYSKEKLYSMLDSIKKYGTDYYITSHSEVDDRASMEKYFEELVACCELVGEGIDYNTILEKYKNVNGKEPDEDQESIILAFINGNKKK